MTTEGWGSKMSNAQSYLDTEVEVKKKKKKKVKHSSWKKAENLCFYNK